MTSTNSFGTSASRPGVNAPATTQVDADRQAAFDPLRAPAANGWTPDRVTITHSRHDGGFAGTALNFALGGVREAPGQRLSTAQVDALAPFYATTYGLDEAYVRKELAKVYLYVGGPAETTNQAMTIGHHVFLPDEQQLRTILDPGHKTWLAHELAHTMQFLANDGGSPHRFLAGYIKAWFIGRNPEAPGSGDGPRVWGGLVTSLRSVGKTEDEIGRSSTSISERLSSSILPAGVIALPIGLAAGGAISAIRATTANPILGSSRGLTLGAGIVLAPALAGAASGMWGERADPIVLDAIGGVGGSSIAALALWRSGAFRTGLEPGAGMGKLLTLGLAAGALVGAATVSTLAAQASANTVRGWSDSAAVLHDLSRRPDHPEDAKPITFKAALHDSLWHEIDAQSAALQWRSGKWDRPDGEGSVPGRNPDTDVPTVDERLRTDFGDRLDWGLQIPLVVGVPGAVVGGAGVLTARTAHTLFDETVRKGRGPGEAIHAALRQLASQNRGIRNSLGIGAAITLAPLITGGFVAPWIEDWTSSSQTARLSGAAAGAALVAPVLSWLLKGRGGSLGTTSAKVAAGAGIAAGVGYLSAGLATDALHPKGRTYST